MEIINKKQVLDICFTSVNERIAQIEIAINDANISITDDTKSSAGDKYETSREMIQQDLNRYQQQLLVANQDLAVLNHIMNSPLNPSVIGVGSLITTDVAVYYLSISLGAIKVEDKTIFVLSANSPIGNVLLGKRVGESIQFNGKEQKILGIN